MSSRPGLGRCRVVRARVDVESSRPESIFVSRLSRLKPSSSQVNVCPYQNEFNVIDKMDLTKWI